MYSILNGGSCRIKIAIFIRQDPPFNMEYISNTYLLSQLQNPVLINDPSEVRNFPEKHIMMNFPELTPPTLISSHIPSILANMEGI